MENFEESENTHMKLDTDWIQSYWGQIEEEKKDMVWESQLDQEIAGKLTEREKQIAVLVANGLCGKEVAQKLGIRHQTVRNRLTVVFHKTGTRNRTELAAKIILSERAAA